MFTANKWTLLASQMRDISRDKLFKVPTSSLRFLTNLRLEDLQIYSSSIFVSCLTVYPQEALQTTYQHGIQFFYLGIAPTKGSSTLMECLHASPNNDHLHDRIV